MKVLAIVERGKGKRNFSCFTSEDINKYCPIGYGGTAREAMADIKVCIDEYRKMATEKGEAFPEVELEYRFDIGAFFDYYPIDITAFAKYIGMNASVLRQYATAIRQPKHAQIEKIRNGIDKISRDLGANLMISQPVVSYVK